MTDITARDPIPRLPPPAERRRLRKAFGVTQEELAGAIGVSRQMIVGYEREGGNTPTGNTRVKYAEILETWRARTDGKAETARRVS